MTRHTQAPDRDNETYVPGHGDVSFGVDRYELEIDYSVDSNRLKGRATLHATALQAVNRIGLDLHALRVAKVTVDGQPVKYRHHRGKLVVTLKQEIAEGTAFTVVVAYSGAPKPMPGLDGDAGWEELADGVIVASQPHGAPSWYPCNDRPSDKAVHRIEVTAPSDYTVVSNGVLSGRRRRAAATTWAFEDTAPMATYLATVQIGRYVRASTKTGPLLHRTPVHTVHPPELVEECAEAFARQPEMLAEFVRLFGPYPFDEYTAVVTADELEIPLEAQGLSIFGANFATTQWQHQRLIAHEMAHQWFGNSLTLEHWNDIWLHEGFACYAEWLWSEASGGPTVAEHAREHWERLDGLEQDLVLADPGPDLMFDDRVYKRGALTVHALRVELGDDPFFDVLRDWTSRFAHGSVTTEDFVAVCEEHAGRGLDDLFDAWLHGTALPSLS